MEERADKGDAALVHHLAIRFSVWCFWSAVVDVMLFVLWRVVDFCVKQRHYLLHFLVWNLFWIAVVLDFSFHEKNLCLFWCSQYETRKSFWSWYNIYDWYIAPVFTKVLYCWGGIGVGGADGRFGHGGASIVAHAFLEQHSCDIGHKKKKTKFSWAAAASNMTGRGEKMFSYCFLVRSKRKARP